MHFTMSLFDEIIDAGTNPPGTGCGVSKALDVMTEADAADFKRALEDRSLFGTTISEVLKKKRNLSVSGYTIQRHRRRVCSCSEETE